MVTDEAVSIYHGVYSTVNARKIPPIVVRSMIKDEVEVADKFKTIRCPTLIIWGAQDKVISPSWAETFSKDIEEARCLIIEQAGHMPQIEKHEVVNNAMIDFVTQCSHR